VLLIRSPAKTAPVPGNDLPAKVLLIKVKAYTKADYPASVLLIRSPANTAPVPGSDLPAKVLLIEFWEKRTAYYLASVLLIRSPANTAPVPGNNFPAKVLLIRFKADTQGRLSCLGATRQVSREHGAGAWKLPITRHSVYVGI
jgi:hypothetical protein